MLSRVTACVASVGRFSARRVRPDADLITDIGLDSIQLFEIWATLEEEMGLTAGLLGAAGPTTPAAIAGELERLDARDARDAREDEAGEASQDRTPPPYGHDRRDGAIDEKRVTHG